MARIAPLLKETSREARVEVDVENADGALKPGMFVNARIEFANRADATVVPYQRRRDPGRRDRACSWPTSRTRRPSSSPSRSASSRATGPRSSSRPALTGHVVTLGHHLLENGTPLILPADAPGAAAPPARRRAGDKR
ncbi:MAG: hypothetical protein M0C28_46360 [Candidatus Moduliflexus flocculans]|nr:hypothetical protein [Candidatus Moduliflexus flocculans]